MSDLCGIPIGGIGQNGLRPVPESGILAAEDEPSAAQRMVRTLHAHG